MLHCQLLSLAQYLLPNSLPVSNPLLHRSTNRSFLFVDTRFHRYCFSYEKRQESGQGAETSSGLFNNVAVTQLPLSLKKKYTQFELEGGKCQYNENHDTVISIVLYRASAAVKTKLYCSNHTYRTTTTMLFTNNPFVL